MVALTSVHALAFQVVRNGALVRLSVRLAGGRQRWPGPELPPARSVWCRPQASPRRACACWETPSCLPAPACATPPSATLPRCCAAPTARRCRPAARAARCKLRRCSLRPWRARPWMPWTRPLLLIDLEPGHPHYRHFRPWQRPAVQALQGAPCAALQDLGRAFAAGRLQGQAVDAQVREAVAAVAHQLPQPKPLDRACASSCACSTKTPAQRWNAWRRCWACRRTTPRACSTRGWGCHCGAMRCQSRSGRPPASWAAAWPSADCTGGGLCRFGPLCQGLGAELRRGALAFLTPPTHTSTRPTSPTGCCGTWRSATRAMPPPAPGAQTPWVHRRRTPRTPRLRTAAP